MQFALVRDRYLHPYRSDPNILTFITRLSASPGHPKILARLSTLHTSIVTPGHRRRSASTSGKSENRTACLGAYIPIIWKPWPRYNRARHRFLTEPLTAHMTRDGPLSRPERAVWHDRQSVCKKHLRVRTTQARHDQSRLGRHLVGRTIPQALIPDPLPNNRLSNILTPSDISIL